jgi:formate hydrogenlyase subunit 3/multisubunit Na+/H+ antiporter MnhD subunit
MALLGIAGALLLVLAHALMKTGAFIATAQVAPISPKRTGRKVQLTAIILFAHISANFFLHLRRG